MAEIKNIPVETTETKENVAAAAEDELLVRFIHPVTFEGAQIAEVDLSGLRDLTGQDLIDAERVWYASGGRGNDQPELGYQAIALLCSRKSGKPIEFFLTLPILEARLVRNTVRNFLRGLA